MTATIQETKAHAVATSGSIAHLDFVDQASFLGLRATEMATLSQMVWIYERDIDTDRLRRFHANLGRGLFGRRIQRSRLPFGRHRWVLDPACHPIDVELAPLPRAELQDWVHRHAQLPIDPEHGPSWRLGVTRFTDGAAAVSLVVSHSIADGVGLCRGIADAVNDAELPLGYAEPQARKRFRSMREDLRRARRDLPDTARAFRKATKLLTARRQDIKHAGLPTIAAHVDRVAAATVYLDENHWDTHAHGRGGTSNSLVGAFAAQLAAKAGRLGRDGRVTLSMPVNERTEGDHRANAMTSVMFAIDPVRLTTDLSGIRSATKKVLSGLRDAPDEKWALLPLTPFIPKAAARRLADVALEYNDYPVGCSNVGALPAEVNRPDGTDADYIFCKLAEQRVRPDKVLSTYGQLFLASGRANCKVFLAVVAYQPGVIESRADLTTLLAETLDDFGLHAVIE
ncbi:condensation domain-containing protein [Mycobacteroides abscessus]|uniref:hypothetical protein n=1 Tax=Mycobacteroides abscessus TaxID=36809 RepID=UPI00092C6DDA|nr:hypothetical protein [Mycobacteroides abscessus]SHQ91713.1 Fatty acyl-AMP ligase FadD28 and polyketide synthase [Mycobacteroides abscessus subsp. abscessus]SHS82445.1 Fatty acyl-AMP ligase FadD28 and polyketide synthase [Mycobacteroides abscessus subsp. abscessus]SHT01113.1 Fatty acyl-AMP ligase FadD28 and polyketide synthase [Mycobacteroides abscessus subsp. abscessus]SKE97401.1 Fatty acyl-AMP ligase FadD28 and polyketide synthase [Mycobacteroides abscessus subsp. abscessus]SKH91340.1 Fatt